RHHEQFRARHADQPQRALGAARARDHAEPHFGERKLRAQCRDPEVTRDGQLEAGPHRIPVDGGHHRLAEALGRGERVAPRLKILPEAVLGISRTNTTRRGRLNDARSAAPRQKASSASKLRPGALGTTNATTRAPHRSSGSPTTATSRTPGCRASTSSISTGWTFSPPLMIMSSTRPATYSSPSASSQPMSPVKYQPS